MNSKQKSFPNNFLVNIRYDHQVNRARRYAKFLVSAGLLTSASCFANAEPALDTASVIQVSRAETFCTDAAVRENHEAHHDTVGNACTRDHVDESVDTNRDAEARAKSASAATAYSDESGGKDSGDSKQVVVNWLAGARIVETSNLQRP